MIKTKQKRLVRAIMLVGVAVGAAGLTACDDLWEDIFHCPCTCKCVDYGGASVTTCIHDVSKDECLQTCYLSGNGLSCDVSDTTLPIFGISW
jgi:hypothetical protein